MDALCKESGIKRHKTCPYTPQQNGISERINHTIMDKVRAMLQETGLSGNFWAETASTAVYIINRSPNSSVGFDVLEERWTGSTPEYNHLRRFGCVAYIHHVQDKISPRAVKGILEGYAQGAKGYRVWLLEEKKIVVSKDVVFNEDQLYKDRDQDKEAEDTTNISKPKKRVTFNSNLEEFFVVETSG